MNPFTLTRVSTPGEALELGRDVGARYLGGGTNLVDLMRQTVDRPRSLVDVSRLPQTVEPTGRGGLMIGAAVRNAVLAEHTEVRRRFPLLARAILAGASPQIRNMATVGGNLLQRTRCTYFYDVDGARCNKREPGQGCDAAEGRNRNHAILGTSQSCVATHPSDMCVALAALDARIHVEGAEGGRVIPMTEFHRLPGDTPDLETRLRPGELVRSVELPPPLEGSASDYRKVRDRASYAFALVSVAAIIAVDRGVVTDVRIALGGLAHKPWRATRAELAIRGGPADSRTFRAAAELELEAAIPLRENGFKVPLARRTLTAVLEQLAARAGRG